MDRTRQVCESLAMLTTIALTATFFVGYPQATLGVQDPAPAAPLDRGLIFGAVTDGAGKPWVGAEVLLESWPFADGIVGEPDRVRATTDENGRFRAEAVPGWEYRVWAHQAMAAGRLRASAVCESAQVGDPVDLQEALGGLAGARLVLTDVEAWQDLAPFQLEWECVTPRMREVVAVPESLEVALPPNAVGRIYVRVLGKDGRHIFSYEHRPRLAKEPPRVEIALPAPTRHLLFVHEEDADTPVAKAQLVAYTNHRTWPLGTTGEDGLLEVLASGKEWEAWGYRVVAPGRVWGFAEKREPIPDGKHKERATEISDAGGAYMTAGLSKGRKARGKVAIGGRPLAGIPIAVVSEAHGQVEPSSYYGGEAKWWIESGADGHFATDQLYHQGSSELYALLSAREVAALPEGWRKGLRRRVFLGLINEDEAVLDAVDLTETMMPWDIFVETPEGLPAARATIVVGASSMDDSAGGLQADRVGRVRLLMPRNGPVGLTIRHESGSYFVYGTARSQEEAIPERPPVWRARLDPGTRITGTVTNGQGEPMAGVSVSVHPDFPYQLDSQDAEPLRVGPVAITAKSVDNSHQLSWRAISRTVLTDDKGRYELHVPRGTGQLQVFVNGTQEKLSVSGDDEVAFDIELPGD